MSNNKNILSLKLELLWWAFTLVLVAVIIIPIQNSVENYPFLFSNILFIIAFITLTRYVFLLRYTFLAHKEKLKIILFFASIPVIFFLINEVHFFQTFLDEKGLESFLGGLEINERNRMGGFIRKEMLFFGIGSVMTAILFPFRMLVSVWRVRNRGTV